MNVKDKNILIAGLGVTGKAVADVLLGRGAKVTVCEAADSPALQSEADRLRSLGADVVIGEDLPAPPPNCELVVPSPGIKPSTRLLTAAATAGVPIWSEIELAYVLFRPTVLAVTGTNGKTTTTALAAEMLRASGVTAVECGNIGLPLIQACADNEAGTVMVTEVSSFQLHYTRDFRPRVAVLLNVTPDHADWHGHAQSYAADKAKVFAGQGSEDWAVLNADEAAWEGMTISARRRYFSLRSPVPGFYVRDGMIYEDDVDPVVVCSVGTVSLPGSHNLQNVLAAAAAARFLGATLPGISKAIESFPGVEHRLEFVTEIRGAKYYNDSKATNPEATQVAVRAFEGPIILLAGGRNKGNDFNRLLQEAADKTRAIILFGESATELAGLAGAAHITWHMVPTLEAAVELAAGIAVPGDIVLLSPACASYDMFSGFEQRGAVFKAQVARLAGLAGAKSDERKAVKH